MNARLPPPSARKDALAAALPAARPLDDAIPSLEVADTLACCCPARAMVQAVMPPTPARPHETELLLCGHHYRASRTALAATGAVVRALPDPSGEVTAWIGARPYAGG
jgi:hypothetical protein